MYKPINSSWSSIVIHNRTNDRIGPAAFWEPLALYTGVIFSKGIMGMSLLMTNFWLIIELVVPESRRALIEYSSRVSGRVRRSFISIWFFGQPLLTPWLIEWVVILNCPCLLLILWPRTPFHCFLGLEEKLIQIAFSSCLFEGQASVFRLLMVVHPLPLTWPGWSSLLDRKSVV